MRWTISPTVIASHRMNDRAAKTARLIHCVAPVMITKGTHRGTRKASVGQHRKHTKNSQSAQMGVVLNVKNHKTGRYGLRHASGPKSMLVLQWPAILIDSFWRKTSCYNANASSYVNDSIRPRTYSEVASRVWRRTQRARRVSMRSKNGEVESPTEHDESSMISAGVDEESLNDDSDKTSTLKALLAWTAAATAFGAVIAYTSGTTKASEYFAGYLLEQSLSVDNLIVFVLIFNYFRVPTDSQPKVLNFGIWGAAVLRLIFIILGAEALETFEPVLLLFAGVLIFSSYKILSGGDDDDDDDLSENSIVKLCRNLINSTEDFDGDNFFNSVGQATPLLIALLVIELSDVVFAVDSVPALFGVTRDPIIVYTSSMFAILSLRAVYKAFASYIDELHYLETAVGLILGFIGGKMVAEFFGAEISTLTSLLVVAFTLGGGIAASYILPDPETKT